MKSIIASLIFVSALHAHAQTSDATLVTPSSAATSEDMHLIQSSPAMEAQAIVAPLMEAAPAPRALGSNRVRVPAAGTTLADISFTSATTADKIDGYFMGNQTIIDTTYQASLYTFRFNHGITDESSIFVDAGFLKSSTEWEGATVDTRQGMRDFEIGYLGRTPSGKNAWIYGGSIVGSPESITQISDRGAGFSGSTFLRAKGGYERTFAKATGGVSAALQYDAEFNTRTGSYYNGQMRGFSEIVYDVTGYYEYPIAKIVDFGVAGGLSSDGNPFRFATTAYHASAYTAIDVMDDAQLKFEAEGETTSYNSRDSGTTTRFTGVLSKAL